MSSKKTPVTQGNEGREKTFIPNQENHSVCCHPTEELGSLRKPAVRVCSMPASRWETCKVTTCGDHRLWGGGSIPWSMRKEREPFTSPSGYKNKTKHPEPDLKLWNLTLNKRIQVEPFPLKAAGIWAALSSADHQTEKCKWFWEVQQKSSLEKCLLKAQIRDLIVVTGREAVPHLPPPDPLRQGLPQNIWHYPWKTFHKEKKIEVPPGNYSTESAFWKPQQQSAVCFNELKCVPPLAGTLKRASFCLLPLASTSSCVTLHIHKMLCRTHHSSNTLSALLTSIACSPPLGS